MAIGLSAMTFSLRTTINAGAKWAIKVVAGGKLKRSEEDGRQTVRLAPTLLVKHTVVGTLWGLLAGGGSLATLQQAALSPPTIELAFQMVVPFAVLGLLVGLLRLRPRPRVP
jgi:hypothetical protein